MRLYVFTLRDKRLKNEYRHFITFSMSKNSAREKLRNAGLLTHYELMLSFDISLIDYFIRIPFFNKQI